MALVGKGRQPGDEPAGVAPPIWSEKAAERGHEVDPAVVGHAPGKRLDLGRTGDQSEIVAEPLDQRSRHGHGTLQAVDGRLARELVCDSRDQAVAGRDGRGTRVEQREAARPIGVLGIAGSESGVAEQGGLLVAEVAAYRYPRQPAAGRAVDLA